MTRFAFAPFCACALLIGAAAQAADEHSWQLYINSTYGISFRFPQEWKQDFGYSEPYFAPPRQMHTVSRGFVQLDLIGGEVSSALTSCHGAAEHKLHPFGSHPSIRSLKVDGQEACLVMPSADQGAPWGAELIVRLPEVVQADGGTWALMSLDADKDFILRVIPTLRFLTRGHSLPPFSLEVAPLKKNTQPATWQQDQPLPLVLIMKNHSSQTLHFSVSPDTFRFAAFTRGERVRLITNPRDDDDSEPPAIPPQPAPPTSVTLNPHQDYEFVVQVRTPYVRQPTGEYSLQVEQDLPAELGPGLVESNTLSVKVGY